MKAIVDSYFLSRRAAGFDLRFWSRPLYDFARHCAARRETFVHVKTAVAWAATASTQGQREARLRKVASLAAFAHAADSRHELVPTRIFVHCTNRRQTPFIFTREQIGSLLRAAAQLPPNPYLRPHTYVTLISLLAATGLRVAEALALQVSNITEDGLVIHKTKFKKSRIVPVHPSVREGIAGYLRRRKSADTDRIFIFDDGRPLRYSIVQYTVQRLMKQIGLRATPGKPHATLHSLRHTFAVRALEAAPTDKSQIEHHMMALSTYLGHVHYSSTYWYLEKTPLILAQVSNAAEAIFFGGER